MSFVCPKTGKTFALYFQYELAKFKLRSIFFIVLVRWQQLTMIKKNYLK